MKKGVIISLIFSLNMIYVSAQTDNTYNQFRQQILSDYSSYRSRILDDYSKFLDTAWKNFDTFKAEFLYPEQKPQEAPKAPNVDITPIATIPQPDAPQPKTKPTVPIDIKPEVSNLAQEYISFPYYTTTIRAPKLQLSRLDGSDENSISRLWKKYQGDRIYEKVAADINQLRLGFQLNDWLTYVLVRKYCDALYPSDINSSILLTHYLLVNMGYNVRIARNDSDQLILLIPFSETVYKRPFLKINGLRYYIFMGETGRDINDHIGSIYTCELPQDAELGKSFDLILDNPKFPSKEKKDFTLSDGAITITGEIPMAAINIAKDYVQTEVPVYASSNLSSKFRQNILRQLKEQIEGLSEIQAVNKILHFIQYAFKYQTDGEQFGYEKPYFVEENFYYPANDCEDRAILLAFLVRNLLNIDVHLLYYPNHEATGVRFTDQSITGDGYIYQDGSKYLICDPTFIGASVGQCMPEYENVKPQVELW